MIHTIFGMWSQTAYSVFDMGYQIAYLGCLACMRNQMASIYVAIHRIFACASRGVYTKEPMYIVYFHLVYVFCLTVEKVPLMPYMYIAYIG